MSALNIKDPEAHRLAADLARRSGKSITEVVIDALRLCHREEQQRSSDAALVEDAEAIIRRVAELPDLDTRSGDEILGYNRYGGFEPDGD